MGRIGTPEIILILVVVVLLFGAKKLPDLARSLGSSAKEFRKGVEEGREGDTEEGADSDSETGSSDGSNNFSSGGDQSSPPPTSD